MNTPNLLIDLVKLEQNLLAIQSHCQRNHLTLMPVTKVIMGDPHIGCLYSKYCQSIGDSRIHDIKRMIRNHIQSQFMLIRSPSLEEARDVVSLCHTSLHSEIEVIRTLNQAALEQKKIHHILIMLEMGDLREGILPDDFDPFLQACLELEGIEVYGIGANATCFAGLIPTPENLAVLEKAAKIFQKRTGRTGVVSGGGTNLFHLLASGTLPDYINHIRVGEGIVMGVDAVYKLPIQGCVQDCFTLHGEVIELKDKPSQPKGTFTHNAFGEDVSFLDQGIRKRAILNIGRLDTDITGLSPILSGIKILGGSSDHLILDVEDASPKISVGSIISFHLNYSALLFAMSSDYVQKQYISKPS
jgi:predicted amino acid racemase